MRKQVECVLDSFRIDTPRAYNDLIDIVRVGFLLTLLTLRRMGCQTQQP